MLIKDSVEQYFVVDWMKCDVRRFKIWTQAWQSLASGIRLGAGCACLIKIYVMVHSKAKAKLLVRP